MNYIIKLNFTE